MSPRPTTADAAVLRETATAIADESFPMLRGVAYNSGARGEQLDEAVQQGFAQLMSAFPGDPSDLVGVRRYLVRCVQSAAWKILRRETRRLRWHITESALDRLDQRPGDAPRSDGVDQAEPFERVLEYEMLEHGRELLAELPEDWRAVLLLSAAGFGTEEIAAQLGLSSRQVRKRVEKANARLAELRR
jgi:RNA polymerase sigma factor (sigma-70 family)